MFMAKAKSANRISGEESANRRAVAYFRHCRRQQIEPENPGRYAIGQGKVIEGLWDVLEEDRVIALSNGEALLYYNLCRALNTPVAQIEMEDPTGAFYNWGMKLSERRMAEAYESALDARAS